MKWIVLIALFLLVLSQNCTKENQVYKCGHQYICIHGTCGTCNSSLSEQCSEYPRYYCKENPYPEENECVHKRLFPKFDIFDASGTLLCFIGSMVASSSGVGGGGLFVPILLLVGRFTPHLATALSSVIIFGSSISNLIIALFQKHPNANRPMIDYDVSLLMTPTVLVGTMLGVLLNVMFPNWLILLLLLLLLGFTTIRTFQKGIKEYREESKALLEAQKQVEMQNQIQHEQNEEKLQFLQSDLERSHNEIDLNDLEMVEVEKKEKELVKDVPTPELQVVEMKSPEQTVYYGHEDDQHTVVETGDSNNNFLDTHDKSLDIELEKVLKSESKRCPPLQWIVLIFCWIILCMSSILKGGKRFPSIIPGIEPCGVWYWTIEVCVIPILLGISIIYGVYLRRRYQYKVLLGYKFLKGDIQWTIRNSILIPLICLSAGVLAGLLGLGGGMVIGPVFLELGVLTQVAANTSSFIIFLTVSSTVVQFVFLGVLPWDYSLWFLCFGFLSSLIGQFLIIRLIKRFKRTSFVVLLLSFTILVSTVLMLSVGIYDLVEELENGAFMGFKTSC